MARYFFDVFDGSITRDHEGLELADLQAVRRAAMRALPAIAAEEILDDGDKQSFVVIARQESGEVVYIATISYVGLMLPSLGGALMQN